MTGLTLEATALSKRTREGTVFGPVDVRAEPGDVVALVGPAGSGRSALVMALAGRMAFSSGTLKVDGRELPSSARWVRKHSSVAPCGGVLGLEGGLRVHEEVNRARWLAGHKRLRPGFEDAATTAGLESQRKTLIRDLPAIDRARLAIASGFVEQTGLVIVDDVGASVSVAQQRELWQLLVDLAAQTRTTVAATTIEGGPPYGLAASVIELPHAPSAADPAVADVVQV